MHPLVIREAVRHVPFQPFRLYLSDGSHFDIPHQDFLTISKLEIIIAVDPSGKDHIPSRIVRVSPIHITRLEPLPQAEPAQ